MNQCCALHFFFSFKRRPPKATLAPRLERGHAGLLRSWRGTAVHRDPHSGRCCKRGGNSFLHLAGVQARGTESRSSCQCEAGSTQKVSGGAFSAEAEGSNPSGGSPHHRRRIEHDGRLAQKRKASPPRCDKALSAPRYEQPCRTPAQEASCSAQPSSLDRRPMSAQFPACRADAAAAGRAHARQPRPVRHGGSLGSNACVAAGRSRPFSRKRLPRAHKKRRARRERESGRTVLLHELRIFAGRGGGIACALTLGGRPT